MAAITFTAPTLSVSRTFYLVRSGIAQANTGQTDWLRVPQGSIYAVIDFNLTAAGGTTPLADLTINSTDPNVADDTYLYKLKSHAAFTQITGAAHLVATVGPGIQAADDVATGATGFSDACLNTVLPPILGLKLVFDRTTADEVYTYSLTIAYNRARAK